MRAEDDPEIILTISRDLHSATAGRGGSRQQKLASSVSPLPRYAAARLDSKAATVAGDPCFGI